jgi:hypothetical protein
MLISCVDKTTFAIAVRNSAAKHADASALSSATCALK